jgi:hypothetical protein
MRENGTFSLIPLVCARQVVSHLAADPTVDEALGFRVPLVPEAKRVQSVLHELVPHRRGDVEAV